MTDKKTGITPRKLIVLALVAVVAFLGGREFMELQNYKESVVVSDAFTKKIMLSDYFEGIKGTGVDTPVYLYDSGVPGGTLIFLGGTHPYEPATMLAAYVVMENISVTKGRVFVIPHANMSASRVGMLGNAYPKFLHVQTSFGPKAYRIGDRASDPLDQWPDPFTYVHYPSKQNLAYTDARNLNRTYPGRPDGNLTEQLAFALMELIRKEKADLYCDTHEASLMYPVVSTYVAHDKALDIAMMAAMELSATTFPMKCEASPKSLRGLSHREVGDYTALPEEGYDGVFAVLMETMEPFIDRVAGKINESLMMEGKDEFLQTASEHGLLYCVPEYNIEFGAPMKYRVGRHLSSVAELVRQMNDFFPEKELQASWPEFDDVMANGIGAYLHDPSKAHSTKIFWN
ncbi:MAG: deacylase [Dethiosulfovibrio peptidovorans]|nr:MAG: deacylase [Dethiosulfovibrio peptidovorans]